MSLVEARADAACEDEFDTKMAWGEYWIERSGASCTCTVWQRRYTCVSHTVVSTSSVASFSSSCDTACEATSGYEAAIQEARDNLRANTGEYECDTPFVDLDQDGLGSCIDINDLDPRVWVDIEGDETACDGVDNDGDTDIDDGLSPTCDRDQKRPWESASVQGDAASSVDVVQGTLLRTEVDAVVQGPHGPLVFSRTYSSRRAGNEASIGVGWVHSFANYLRQMPDGDDRWQVQLGTGENQYFRCANTGSGDYTCAIDDHIPRGNLRKFDPAGGSNRRWFFYPGDGTRYEFSTTALGSPARYAYTKHIDGAGFTLSEATTDGGGRIETVKTATAAIFLFLDYDEANQLGKLSVAVNDTPRQIVNYTVGASGCSGCLATVAYAASLDDIDTDTAVNYTYDPDTKNLTAVTRTGSNIAAASFGFDGADRVTSVADATKDLDITYPDCSGCGTGTSSTTQVVYNVTGSESTTVKFTHAGRWVTFRTGYTSLGGVPDKEAVWDDNGRVVCRWDDRGIMTRYTLADSQLPTAAEVFEVGKSCTTVATANAFTDLSWAYNTSRMSWRPVWSRMPSVFSGAASCTGGSRPSGCTETKYDYVSSSDDRLQWVTRTGYTRLISGTATVAVRKQRIYYFGLDTGTCTGSYAGLPCRIEDQKVDGTVLARTDYTYVASGTTAGALKTVSRYKSSGASLTTTYANHNPFGSPEYVYDETGTRTRYTFNGWNAVTSVIQDGALLDVAVPPVASLSPATSYSYNGMRELDTVTLPKGNKLVYKYLTGASDYGRLKAYATADASGNLLEILKHGYDQMGRGNDDRVLDSISSSCTEDTCSATTRTARAYDAAGRLLHTYLYTTSATTRAATSTNTYTGAYLTASYDYRGKVMTRWYDGLGRLSAMTGDVGGANATTQYTYDVRGQLLTTTSPEGVVTTTEHDDFGQLVLERSKTRGDVRYEHDAAGREKKRQKSSYNSTSNAQTTCYTTDWLGRQTTVNYECDGSTDTTFDYDGDNTPSDACPSTTRQAGRLSRFSGSYTTARVLCYHPRGELYAYYQYSASWDNYYARGAAQIFDLNGNLTDEFVNDRALNRDWARHIEYVYDGTLQDRVKYVRHKLTSAGGWTYQQLGRPDVLSVWRREDGALRERDHGDEHARLCVPSHRAEDERRGHDVHGPQPRVRRRREHHDV